LKGRFILLAVAVVGLSLVVIPAAQPAYGEHVLGPQRILVALVTWGPRPFSTDDVRQTFAHADELYRQMSYGKTSLLGTVTPWLTVSSQPSGCSLPALRAAATAAASSAGFDPGQYDRVVFVHPAIACPWSGVTLAATVLLNGAVTPYLIAHELGHSFGLGHANLTDCRRHGCGALEYGDPYDTMGTGLGDFSAWGKFTLGWLTRLTRPARNGTYDLAAIEEESQATQALVVTTANDQYWIELRSRPAADDDGHERAGAGVIVRVSASPDLNDFGSTAIPNLLIADPAGRHRPNLRSGDGFVDPGAFSLRVLASAGSRARVRFHWIDSTIPRPPRFTAGVVAGRVEVSVDGARETGSGVGHYDVSLDDRRRLRFGSDETDEPVLIGRPLPGTHTVKVVAVDRAGNRSRAAVRRVQVP
jgi:hypothetical protein